jgi:hypothetical protein
MNLLKYFRNRMTKRRVCYKALQRLNLKDFGLQIFPFTSISLFIGSFCPSFNILFNLLFKAQLLYSVFSLHFILYD